MHVIIIIVGASAASLGTFGLGLLVLFVMMISGDGDKEVGVINMVSYRSPCLPEPRLIDVVDDAYRGEPGWRPTEVQLNAVFEPLGIFWLDADARVKIVEAPKQVNASVRHTHLLRIAPLAEPTKSCWVLRDRLEMSFADWVKWKWFPQRYEQIERDELLATRTKRAHEFVGKWRDGEEGCISVASDDSVLGAIMRNRYVVRSWRCAEPVENSESFIFIFEPDANALYSYDLGIGIQRHDTGRISFNVVRHETRKKNQSFYFARDVSWLHRDKS